MKTGSILDCLTRPIAIPGLGVAQALAERDRSHVPAWLSRRPNDPRSDR